MWMMKMLQQFATFILHFLQTYNITSFPFKCSVTWGEGNKWAIHKLILLGILCKYGGSLQKRKKKQGKNITTLRSYIIAGEGEGGNVCPIIAVCTHTEKEKFTHILLCTHSVNFVACFFSMSSLPAVSLNIFFLLETVLEWGTRLLGFWGLNAVM